MRDKRNDDKPPSPPNRRQAGFTLAEVLLVSAMAAILLTALAHSTAVFTTTVSHLESKAGITDVRESVLRRMTREIREAWWVVVPDQNSIQLSDPDGELTEYWLDTAADALMVRRPNGDEGVVLNDVETFTIAGELADRKREGPTEFISDVLWFNQVPPSSSPIPMAVTGSSQLGVPATAPVQAAMLDGSAEEHVVSVEAGSVTLPIAFIPDPSAATEADKGTLTISLYQARGPGVAKPKGSALGEITVAGSSLPQAVLLDADTSLYEVPVTATSLALSLPADLDPGRGYVVKIVAEPAAAGFVIPAYPETSPDADLMALKSGSGGGWVELPLVVPFQLSGDATRTSTILSSEVVSVTVSLGQGDETPLSRTATLLSQSLAGDSDWLGVVPGDVAP